MAEQAHHHDKVLASRETARRQAIAALEDAGRQHEDERLRWQTLAAQRLAEVEQSASVCDATLRAALAEQSRRHDNDVALREQAAAAQEEQARIRDAEQSSRFEQAAIKLRRQVAFHAAEAASLRTQIDRARLVAAAQTDQLAAAVRKHDDDAVAAARGAAALREEFQTRLLSQEQRHQQREAALSGALQEAARQTRRDIEQLRAMTELLEMTRLESRRRQASAEDRLRRLIDGIDASNRVNQQSRAAAADMRPPPVAPLHTPLSSPLPATVPQPAQASSRVSTPIDNRTAWSLPESDLKPPVTHVNQLFALEGDEFVATAYHVALGRSPDPHGAGYFAARLAAEQDRAQILFELVNSNEGRARPQTLPGLQALVDARQPGRRRLRRWLQRVLKIDNTVSRLEASIGFLTHAQTVHASKIEATVTASAAQQRETLARIETGLDRLHAAGEANRHATAFLSDSMLDLQRRLLADHERLTTTVAGLAGAQAATLHAANDADAEGSKQALQSTIDGQQGPAALIEGLTTQLAATSQAVVLARR